MSFLTKIQTLSPTLFRTAVRCHSTGSSTHFLNDFMTTKEKGPVQLSIEHKITEALNPSILELTNESHLHSHHAAMKGNTNPETHFKAIVVSEEFKGKRLMQRHRMIYSLLKDELENKGLHALSLTTKTQDEL